MKKTSQAYQQFHTLQRLKAAGCTLHYSCLYRPEYPLDMTKLTSAFGSDVIPTPPGSGIMIPLRIQAFAQFNILRWIVRLPRICQLAPLPLCREHPDFRCFEQSSGRDHLKVAERLVLNDRRLRTGQLAPGETMEGYLLLTTTPAIPSSVKPRLTVEVVDLSSEAYPFLLELENKQQIFQPAAQSGRTDQQSTSGEQNS